MLATCGRPRRTGRGLERAETAERRGLVDAAIVALLFHGRVPTPFVQKYTVRPFACQSSPTPRSGWRATLPLICGSLGLGEQWNRKYGRRLDLGPPE